MDMSNMGEMLDKLKDKIDFPAAKERIVKAADDMTEMADDAKDWIRNDLPEGVYNSIEEVKTALGM